MPLSPVGGTVLALAMYDRGSGPELCAGGAFPDVLQGAGLVRANNIARRGGAGWRALGNSPSDLEGYVEDCQLWDDGHGTALFAAGRFERAGQQDLARIARWDGAQWSSLATGLDGAAYELALHDDGGGTALFAGGGFATAGGVPAAFVARWDGTFWTSVGINPPDARSMAVHDDGTGPVLYVGFGAAKQGTMGDVWKWDGSSWTSIGPSDSRVGSLYSYDDGSGPALYAGGGFSVIGGTVVSHLARWDGSLAQDLNARWCQTCPKPGHAPTPGHKLQVQLWYRDPLNSSNRTTGFSNAIEVDVCP